MSKFADTNEKNARWALKTYKTVENGVVKGYKKIESGVVGGFNKLCDKIIEKIFAKNGESVEKAKKRLLNKTETKFKKIENNRVLEYF